MFGIVEWKKNTWIKYEEWWQKPNKIRGICFQLDDHIKSGVVASISTYVVYRFVRHSDHVHIFNFT